MISSISLLSVFNYVDSNTIKFIWGWKLQQTDVNMSGSPETTMVLIHLTHWGRVTHICVSKLTIIGSDNGLSPDRRQAIIWTNAGLMLIRPLGTNFSEISIKLLTYSFKKMRLKVSSAKRWPFCLGLNVLTNWPLGDVVGILTHWGPDKMADISQTTFSNVFS